MFPFSVVGELPEHYSMENPASLTVYDEEALTALRMMGRFGGKLNEMVKQSNEYGVFLDNMQNVVLPQEVREAIILHIQSGDFDTEIEEYLDHLNDRVDVLLGTVKEGTTTMDAEVIDIRTTANGVTFSNAGEAVRSIGNDVNEIRRGRYNIKYALAWELGCSLTTNAELYTEASQQFGVAHHRFPRGTRIDYTLYSTANSSALATGDDTQPLSSLKSGAEIGTPTTGSYIVQDDFETLWFMTDTSQIGNTRIAVSRVMDNARPITWHKGHVMVDGTVDDASAVYRYTDPIKVPAGHKLCVTAQASNTVAVISQVTADGDFLYPVATGLTGLDRNDYEFITDRDAYVRICTSVQPRTDTEVVTRVNNINLKIEPYTDKYRVPTFSVGNGHVNVSASAVKNDGVYKYSDKIRLFPGETIQFTATGSSGIWMLSEWDYNPTNGLTFVQGLCQGDARIHLITYTNERDTPMWVRISTKIVPSAAHDRVTELEEFTDVKVYYKNLYYKDVMDHPLYGKSIALIGDSLAYGNNLGPGATWLRHLAVKYNMKETNLGVNGAPVAGTDPNAMVSRLGDIPASDYVVLIGGANDLRLNVPVDTFRAGLVTSIETIRANNPGCKILFMTNMNRFGTTNTLGHSEEDYATAMIEVCRELCVPCFDNYHNLGIYFRDHGVSVWADELRVGNAKFTGADDTQECNYHLSRAGYLWVLPVYENILTGL